MTVTLLPGASVHECWLTHKSRVYQCQQAGLVLRTRRWVFETPNYQSCFVAQSRQSSVVSFRLIGLDVKIFCVTCPLCERRMEPPVGGNTGMEEGRKVGKGGTEGGSQAQQLARRNRKTLATGRDRRRSRTTRDNELVRGTLWSLEGCLKSYSGYASLLSSRESRAVSIERNSHQVDS